MAHARYALVSYFLADATSDPAAKRHALVVADKAVAVAPNLADAYSARGVTRLSFSRDWSGAQADLEQARKLNAGDSGTQIVYWRLLNALGRNTEAVEVARKATELDPVNTNAWTSLGRSLNGVGDFAAARVALERALAISPNSSYGNYQFGCNYLYQSKSQDALDVFKNMGDVGYKYAGIAMAEHSLGRRAESDTALAKLIKEFPGAAYQTAQAYAWRGETDKAYEWLGIALDRNDGGVTFVKSDPIMARYHDDPRFAAFLRKLGLPE